MNLEFKKLAEIIQNENLHKTAISLSEKYKPSLANELERANKLAYSLYFKCCIQESLSVCDILGEEQFNGNYNLWTWIQSTLLLKCWIHEKMKHDEIQIIQILKTINAAFDFGDDKLKKKINKRAKTRRFEGSLLNYNRIEQAIIENDKGAEIDWRISHFKELLFIYFFGGSDLFPKEKALKELNDNENIIKRLI